MKMKEFEAYEATLRCCNRLQGISQILEKIAWDKNEGSEYENMFYLLSEMVEQYSNEIKDYISGLYKPEE